MRPRAQALLVRAARRRLASTPASTLARQTEAQLARVDAVVQPPTAGVWASRLARALAPSADARRTPPAVVLYGAPQTGADGLLLALVEDPLADEGDTQARAQRAALAELVERDDGGEQEAICVSYGADATPAPRTLPGGISALAVETSAPFLQAAGGTSVVYLPSSMSTHRALATLLVTPRPVLVLDDLRLLAPFTTSAPGTPPKDTALLQAVLRHPGLTLVVARLAHAPGAERRLQDALEAAIPFDTRALARLGARAHWVDVRAAADGFAAFRQAGRAGCDPRDKARLLQLFSDKLVASNIGGLQAALSPAPTAAAAAAVRQGDEAMAFLLDLALDSASYDLVAHADRLDGFSLAAKSLAGQSAQLATGFFTRALDVPRRVGELAPEGAGERRVSEAVVSGAEEAGRRALGRFGWAGLVAGGRVDDVGEEVGAALRAGWGGEGEKTLIYQTGVLSVLAQSLSTTLERTLSNPPHPSLHSPVLINDLPRAAPVHPALLLGPVDRRLAQLTAATGPVGVLALRAQRAVRQTYALSAGALAGGYAAWVAEALAGEHAAAIGVLGAVGAARWGLGRWEGAKRKFWLDFGRVKDGLEEDLQKNTHEAVSTVLLARPRAAVLAMEALVAKRRAELDGVVEEVERLRERVRAEGAMGADEGRRE